MNSRIGPFLLAGLWSVVFIYLVLALAEAGGLAACHWAFPRWFGCVLYLHESLAAGLIGAAGALIAAEAGARLRLPSADGGPGLIVAAAPGIAGALTDALRRSGAF